PVGVPRARGSGPRTGAAAAEPDSCDDPGDDREDRDAGEGEHAGSESGGKRPGARAKEGGEAIDLADAWAFARYDLGMSDAEFRGTTPRRFHRLVGRWKDDQMRRDRRSSEVVANRKSTRLNSSHV